MKNKSFFSDLKLLERQYFLITSPDIPSKESRLTYNVLINFLYGFTWTKSKNSVFIVSNMYLDSEQLAEKYNAEAEKEGRNTKSSSTFRVQRAALSKFFYSIFGVNFADGFYSVDADEHSEQDLILKRIQTVVKVIEQSSDTGYHLNLPDSATKYVSANKKFENFDTCDAEILFLSRNTDVALSREIELLNKEKLGYILGVLHEPLFIEKANNKVLNAQKIELIMKMNQYSEDDSYTRKDMIQRIKIQKKQYSNIQEKEENTEVQRDLRKKQLEIQDLKRKLNASRVNAEELTQQICDYKETLQRLEKELSVAKKTIEELSSENDSLKRQFEDEYLFNNALID